MNQVIKTFLGIALMLIIVLVGAGLIVCGMDAQRAEKANSDYAAVLTSYNFSDEAIAMCQEEAKADNYDLTVKAYDTDSDGIKDTAECILEYDYTLKMLNSSKTNTGTDSNKHHYSRIVIQ